MSDEARYPIIYDLSLEGGIDKKGTLQEVWNVDAIMNSIRMFFASFRGEMIRSPNIGGAITTQIHRPMSDVDVDFMESVIRSAFNNDFKPKLQIESLEIEPDFERRFYKISILAYSPDAGLFIEVDERIRAQA